MNLVPLISNQDCKLIYKYLKENTSGTYSKENIRPWFENNNIFFKDIENNEISTLVRNYVCKLNSIISLKYKTIVYPTFVDLVLWNQDKSMPAHVDNEVEGFKHRHISAVTYLNNDFKGGRTFINDIEYTPKKGYTLIFKSDTFHGVTKITEGQRGILATWFTKDFKHFYL